MHSTRIGIFNFSIMQQPKLEFVAWSPDTSNTTPPIFLTNLLLSLIQNADFDL